MSEVSEDTVYREKQLRLERCKAIIADYTQKKDLVSVVVLSCKRPNELLRLLYSMSDWLKKERQWMETWFVDNGSNFSPTLQGTIYKKFDCTIWHPSNVGMGPAINDVLSKVRGEYVLFIEDDLEMVNDNRLVAPCIQLFRAEPTVGIIKLKDKKDWEKKPYRRISKPRYVCDDSFPYRLWLPSNPWNIFIGNRPWFAGIHNCWSLGPVMFRHCAWKENGPLPVAQGRGQAIAAEDIYARSFNSRWVAARFEHIRPFSQPTTEESPGYKDTV